MAAEPEAKEPAQQTKAELQKELETAGLPSEGKKDELVERVENLDKVHVPDTYVAQIKPKG